MRVFLSVVVLLQSVVVSRAQVTTEHQIDDGAIVSYERVESSGDEQGLEQEERDSLRRDPLSMNDANREQLEGLGLLSPFQIEQFFIYRKMMGPLLDKYEMQAIPGWDIQTIRALFPYVTIRNATGIINGKSMSTSGGSHRFLFRVGTNQLFPNKSVDEAYTGDRFSSVFRYQYQSRVVSYGFTGAKDAGERWRSGNFFLPFDFWSPYWLFKGNGSLRRVVVGDFTVQMGQGLIQWQRLSFGKSGELTGIKRQGEALQPYRSSGSFYFYRGAGVSITHRKHQWTLFLSHRRLDARLMEDSLNRNAIHVASIIRSGYHRTLSEQATRDRLGFLSSGGQWKVNVGNGHLALNFVHHRLGYPMRPTDAPYDHYDFQGKNRTNFSLDHSLTFGNLHWFGEFASSGLGFLAFSTGMLVSFDARFAMGLLIRDWSQGYQAFYSSGFGEGSSVTNERGLYTSLFFRPVKAIRLEGYVDLFRVPWLTYSLSQPVIGFDQMLRFTYAIDRNRTFYVQLRSRSRYKDENTGEFALDSITNIRSIQCRAHAEGVLSPGWEMRVRMETVKTMVGSRVQEGWLGYVDLRYLLSRSGFELQVRVQYHSTDDYASRIFAYEPDVLYAGKTRFFYGQAFRWCLIGSLPIYRNRDRKINMWLRISRSVPVSESHNYLNVNIKSGIFPLEFQSQLQFQF